MKLISNQISPHFLLPDALHAVKQIVVGKKDISIPLKQNLQTENVRFFNSARTALAEIVRIVGPALKDEKKIGIPAFSCAVMATPFLTAGREICWIDTDKHGNISFADFEKKSNQLGMVLVPDIFGQTSCLEEIFTVAKEKRIFIIADGAHSFDTSTKNCHAKILSFGREKDVSCISGGALLWPNTSPFSVQFDGIDLPLPSQSWTIRHLIQPIIFSLTLPWWNIGGKYIAAIFNKSKILPRAVTASEREGKEDFPQTKMPPEIQHVLLRSLRKRTDDLSRRSLMAHMWEIELKKLFPNATITIPDNNFRVILTGVNREVIVSKAKKIGFHLNEWDGEPIAPFGVQLEKFGYHQGQCPHAEDFTRHYVTFPTNKRTTEKDVKRFAQYFASH